MARSAVLNVSVLVDAAKAASELNQTAAKFESFGKKLVGAAMAAVAIKGVTDLAKTVVSSASDMQQAMGGTDKVFGSSASEIHSWAKDTSDSIRLPAVAVEQFATLIKTQLNATGQPIEQLVQSTKDLIQVGADLSAVTGADLADSIAAVKSALAGEYDPIQNLGVAMTGASVQAKALALAHGDTAAAASDAIIMQARVAEIMDKSAFATGAAAEEADSFQGRMDSLTEKAQNLAATAGGPLLDSLGNIIGSLTDVAGGVTTVASGLGTMLGSVLALPAPIQAVVLGLAAFTAISATWGTKAFSAFSTFASGIKSATTSVSGLKSALSSIGPSLAGGALLVGIALVIAGFAKAIGEVTEGAQKGQDALQGYRDAIVAAGGASTDATAAAFKSAVLTSDAFKGLVTTGFSANEAVSILTGTQEDWIKIQSNGSDTTKNLTNEVSKQVDGFIDANGQAKGLAQAQIDGAKAMGGHADAVDADTKAMQDAAAESDRLKKAMDAAKQAADSTVGNAALNTMKSAAEDATRATDLLSLALDKMTGGTRTTDAAVADFNKSITGIGSAFEDTTKKGGYNQAALTTWNVAVLTSTEAGQGIYDALTQVSGAYEASVGAAYASANASGGSAAAMAAAQTEATRAHDSFMAQAGAMHLSADETAQLASQLGVLDAQSLSPKVFELIAQDQQARQAVIDLQNAGIPAKDFTVNAGVDGALGTVDDLIQYVDKSGATVTVDSTVKPATAAVAGLTSTTDSTTATTTTKTDTAPAAQAVNQLAAQTNATQAYIQVGANLGGFSQAMTQIMSPVRSITFSILGNTDPVMSAIRSVTNGSYTATINVTANVSQAQAAIASIPRSLAITAPPAPVPAPGLSTFGAPTLAGASTRAASASTNVNYNITLRGGITDPDGAARAIGKVLDSRARRSSSVVAR